MDEETANSYGSRYLERLDEPEQQEASAQPSVNAESHTRAEIDEIARGYGLDPDDYNNKQEVADAINEAV